MVLETLQHSQSSGLLFREFKPMIVEQYAAPNVTKNKILKALQQCLNENLIFLQNNHYVLSNSYVYLYNIVYIPSIK